MKKIVLSIIIAFFTISSVNAMSFEKSLNLDIWAEVYEINQFKIKDRYFVTSSFKNALTDVKYLDEAFKAAIFEKFSKWDLKKYQVKALIKEYKIFTYYANKFFAYLAKTERWNVTPELSKYIWKTYSDLTGSYQRLTNIIK